LLGGCRGIVTSGWDKGRVEEEKGMMEIGMLFFLVCLCVYVCVCVGVGMCGGESGEEMAGDDKKKKKQE